MPELRSDDGRRLTYRELGSSGPTLICHPGGPGYSSRYLSDLGGLDQSFRLVLIDPRGTGGSDRPAERSSYALGDYVADLDALRRHLDLDQVAILGHSHGGTVAMAYAIAHPERVRALVLVAAVDHFDKATQAAQTAAVEARAGEPWYPEAVAALTAEDEAGYRTDVELRAVIAAMMPLYFAHFDDQARAYLATMVDEAPVADALRCFNTVDLPTMDLRPGLTRLAVPALVLAGEADFICGPVVARAIASALPGAELVILPDVGHFIFAEAPDRFLRAVTTFLERVLPTPPA